MKRHHFLIVVIGVLCILGVLVIGQLDGCDPAGGEDTSSEPAPSTERPITISPRDEEVAELASALFRSMWNPYLTSQPFRRPDFVENNAYTRLPMRWPEYYLAYLRKHPERFLAFLDPVAVTFDDVTEEADGRTIYVGTAFVRFERVDVVEHPSGRVIGDNVAFEMEVTEQNDELIITALDLVFSTDYRNMRDEIIRRASNGEWTIEIVDDVVDEAIEQIQ